MKKSKVYESIIGSAHFIIAHAKWQKKRGRRPSISYKRIRNPEKALAIAMKDKDLIDKLENELNDLGDSTKYLNNMHSDNAKADSSFKVIINHEEVSQHSTYEEAFKHFHNHVTILRKGASHKWIEADAIKHIVKTPHGPVDCTIDFFLAKNLACKLDIFKFGKLQKSTSPESSIAIDLFFLKAEDKNLILLQDDFKNFQ
ncbi:hypothetical protein K8R32_01510, partial [bacterium]|nr:hypothetical protein [bacterium]